MNLFDPSWGLSDEPCLFPIASATVGKTLRYSDRRWNPPSDVISTGAVLLPASLADVHSEFSRMGES
ncbi:hypothetical protein GGP81_001887 [Salinibacter ruber]|nr:hypothetical protein [Salinibacter ruber]